MTKPLSRFLPAELMTGQEKLDEDHDGIFNCIMRLRAVSVDSDRLPEKMLRELIDSFTEHFTTEERLAQEASIEFLVHGQEHAKNLRLLEKAVGELAAGKLDRHSFLRYLEYWFEHHINQFDKRLAGRLAEAEKRA